MVQALQQSALERPTSAAMADPPTATQGLFRLSMAYFLAALILLLVTLPFVMELSYGQRIESALVTLVLLTAVLAVGGRRRSLLAAGALVTPALVGHWLWHLQPDLAPRELSLVAGIAFAAFVTGHLLRFILCAPRVNSEVLCAAVSTYLMMGLLWSFAYTLVGRLVPRAFLFTVHPDVNRTLAGFESLYFSFATLTTVGYGDIVPVANVARLLAMVESTTGTFYVTILIARLVSLYATVPPSQLPQPSQAKENQA
jgi:hypothetical protein